MIGSEFVSNKPVNVRRGEIYLVNLGKTVGSEQSGSKYCVVVQNNTGNRFSPTTIVCPITKVSHNKNNVPTHILLTPDDKNNLEEESLVLCEQVRTIDKSRIIKYKGILTKEKIEELNEKMFISVIGV